MSLSAGVPLWLLLLFPLAGFLINAAIALVRPSWKGLVSLVGPGAVLASFAVAVAGFLRLQAPGAPEELTLHLWHWIEAGDLKVDIALRLDHLSSLMALVITGVGGLIHVFSIGYMKEDAGYARYFAYLNLFIVFMLVLVLGSSMPVMFIGWEGVGLCSYLLIGFWFGVEANADAGKKAFIMNRIGDFGFLMAMFLTWHALGTMDFAEIAARVPQLPGNGTVVTAIALFLALGCVGKSAQIPLYTWLPDAMAGPTPVSALIHAATMVTAGVYLVVRSNAIFASSSTASLVVAVIGAATALFAGTIGLRQNDIKKVLAFSTVSQLGLMFLAVGSGAYVAGIFHLVTHAFFKALLFLGAGSVIHAMHHAYHSTHSHADPQDMRNMGGLKQWMPWTSALMWIATLAIAGIPVFSGFFSKDEILVAVFGRGAAGQGVFYLLWLVASLASLLTAVYMGRLMMMTFHGANRTGIAEQARLHEAPWVMTLPVAVLGLLSVVGGVINLPHFAWGHEWLAHWLEPVLAPSRALVTLVYPTGATEAGLIGLAALLGVAGLVLGTRGIRRRGVATPAEAAPETGFGRVLQEQYFVDALYDRVIVRPVQWFARTVLWKTIDQWLVDGIAVMGSARLLQGFGWLGSRFQTGQLGLYLLVFVAGAVWVLGVVLQ